MTDDEMRAHVNKPTAKLQFCLLADGSVWHRVDGAWERYPDEEPYVNV